MTLVTTQSKEEHHRQKNITGNQTQIRFNRTMDTIFKDNESFVKFMFDDILEKTGGSYNSEEIMKFYLTNKTTQTTQTTQTTRTTRTSDTSFLVLEEKIKSFVDNAKKNVSEIELKHQMKMYLIECLVSMVCRGTKQVTYQCEHLLLQSILLDFHGLATLNEIQKKFCFLKKRNINTWLEHVQDTYGFIHLVEIGSFRPTNAEQKNDQNEGKEKEEREEEAETIGGKNTETNSTIHRQKTKTETVFAWYIHYPSILHMCIQIADELSKNETTSSQQNTTPTQQWFCHECKSWRMCDFHHVDKEWKCKICKSSIDKKNSQNLCNIAVSEEAKTEVRNRELILFYFISKYLEESDNDYKLRNEEDYDLDIRIKEILSFEEAFYYQQTKKMERKK